MDTDQTSQQLSQCLTALASSNAQWWQALAITQKQADEITFVIMTIMGACIAFALIQYLLKHA